jgi:hypothetical protein
VPSHVKIWKESGSAPTAHPFEPQRFATTFTPMRLTHSVVPHTHTHPSNELTGAILFVCVPTPAHTPSGMVRDPLGLAGSASVVWLAERRGALTVAVFVALGRAKWYRHGSWSHAQRVAIRGGVVGERERSALARALHPVATPRRCVVLHFVVVRVACVQRIRHRIRRPRLAAACAVGVEALQNRPGGRIAGVHHEIRAVFVPALVVFNRCRLGTAQPAPRPSGQPSDGAKQILEPQANRRGCVHHRGHVAQAGGRLSHQVRLCRRALVRLPKRIGRRLRGGGLQLAACDARSHVRVHLRGATHHTRPSQATHARVRPHTPESGHTRPSQATHARVREHTPESGHTRPSQGTHARVREHTPESGSASPPQRVCDAVGGGGRAGGGTSCESSR